jgi:hypothetical protein
MPSIRARRAAAIGRRECTVFRMSTLRGSVAAVLGPLGDGDVLPLLELRKLLPGDVTRQELIHARRRGVLVLEPKPDRYARTEISRAEAERLVVAAMIAVAARVAIATSLQVVKGAGLTPAVLLACLCCRAARCLGFA